jgi:mRNA interferase YafQ
MKNLKTTNRFEKELFKMLKRGKSSCDPEDYKKIQNILLSGSAIPEKYCDHKLQGNMKGFRGLHINPDWVLVYRTDSDNVYMQRTGTHTDIFKM